MEKMFIKLHDANSKSSVYVNLLHVAYVAQKGIPGILVGLSNGHTIEDNRSITQFENLIQDFVYSKETEK